MRKIRLAGISLLLALAFIIPGCKKDLKQLNTEQRLTIAEARQFFESEYAQTTPTATANARAALNQWPDWTHAETISTASGEAMIIPVSFKERSYMFSRSSRYYFPLDSITKLYIHKSRDGKLLATKITYLPDDSCIENQRSYSGIILVEDWKGKKLATYQKLASGELLVSTPEKDQPSNARMECVYFYGHNYSVDDPEGYSYTEFIGCYNAPDPYVVQPTEDEKILPPLTSGGGGRLNFGAAPAVIIESGKNPIGDVDNYLNCFRNVPGNSSNYEVSIAVVQPKPGTRETWVFKEPKSIFSPPIFVGHTFLILTQFNSVQTITRNIGFYPKNDVMPENPTSPSHYNNDENLSYHVMLTITMNSTQFFNVINYITQGQSFLYDLNDNNCTTFALGAVGASGIYIPSTKGTWKGGGGYNPGDLGEDIRRMTPTATIKPNAISNFHPNLGNCN